MPAGALAGVGYVEFNWGGPPYEGGFLAPGKIPFGVAENVASEVVPNALAVPFLYAVPMNLVLAATRHSVSLMVEDATGWGL